MIQYVESPAAPLDGNNRNPYRNVVGEDFVLGGRSAEIVAPFTGTIHITEDLLKRGATTDDVSMTVLRNGAPVLRRTLAVAEAGRSPR